MMEDSVVIGNAGLLDFSYTLIDVNRCGKLELLKLSSVIAAVFLMEQSRQEREIVKHLWLLSENIMSWTPMQIRQFNQWVDVFIGRDLPELEREDLHRVLEHNNPEEVEQMISNLERVMKEARWKHRMEGKQEGMKEGLQEGKLEIARRMLQQGMSTEQIKALTELTDEQLNRLKH